MGLVKHEVLERSLGEHLHVGQTSRQNFELPIVGQQDAGLTSLNVCFGATFFERSQRAHGSILGLGFGADVIIRLRLGPFPQHRRLVLREQGPLVEKAPDLPIQLPHRPTAAERFGLVETPSVFICHGEQLDVVRPGQWEECRDLPKRCNIGFRW